MEPAASRQGKAWRSAGDLLLVLDRLLIYMLLAYSKDEQDDLSPAQKRVLSRLVREEFS